MSEIAEEILDEITVVHELRAALWLRFGARSVPYMVTTPDGAELKVRGSEGKFYLVTVREVAPE